MFYKKRTVIVLGASGGLGSEIMDCYSDHNVIGLDAEQLDITNEKSVMAFFDIAQPDLVFNCAAFTDVDGSEKNKKKADIVNGYSLKYLSNACKKHFAILVHYSTGMVFSGKNKLGYNEDDKTNPVNAYGQTKLLGEQQIQENMSRFYIIRTSWLFGNKKAGKKDFNSIMLDLAKKGKVNAVNDEFGRPTYIEDLAQTSRLIITSKKDFGIYHIVNECIASRYDWAKAIFEITGDSPILNSVKGDSFKRLAKRPKYEILNNNKFMLLRDWRDALEDCLTL